jgi:hypothetical protein
MPNHVQNILRADGISELPIYDSNENGEKFFDFNKVIPMPESLQIESGSVTEQCIVYYLTDKCTLPLRALDDEKKSIVEKNCKQ